MQAPTVPRHRRDRLARRFRAVAALAVAVLLLGGMLGGCARVRAALAVQPDDTVTGELIVATPAKNAADAGPALALPADLARLVEISAYRQDGYTGSLVRFSHLGFDQVTELTRTASPAGNRIQFALRRVGGRVLISGAVDLTTVSVDKADFQLKMSFPGRVIETNGEVDTNTVSWTFTPGVVGDLNATVAYADPDAPSPWNWAVGLGTVVALASVAVVVIARRTRNPPLTKQSR